VFLRGAKRVGNCWCCSAGGGRELQGLIQGKFSFLLFHHSEWMGTKQFIHTKYRHDSSFLAYFQHNAFRSQLRPSDLFSVAEQLVVRCRN